MAVYITGDTHGDFRQIREFCVPMGTKRKDIMIVLGDSGLNYFGDERDDVRKRIASRNNVTYLIIHGNHEMRPESTGKYEIIEWNGGLVYREKKYSRLLFAKDGEIYRIGDKNVMVIGGAYSVDKPYRIQMGYRWFSDEQPSTEIKRYVEQRLEREGWKIDVVLSHTCPRKYEPVECFLPGIEQAKVDKSTEDWLDRIEDRLDYKEWYCGHWHINKRVGKVMFLFHDIKRFAEEKMG